MKPSPIEIFKHWFDEEMSVTKVAIPTACCLSTIGLDGYPNARFVSLKGIVGNNFIITGTLRSRKGLEIHETNKVALTFWWAETERQIRVQGDATAISTALADRYFAERNRDSQIVSIVSHQGQVLHDSEELHQRYHEIEANSAHQPLARPDHWGGYSIEPIRIEFLEFSTSRFHNRTLYQLTNGQWATTDLQP